MAEGRGRCVGWIELLPVGVQPEMVKGLVKGIIGRGIMWEEKH